jgi:hypothetical protein
MFESRIAAIVRQRYNYTNAMMTNSNYNNNNKESSTSSDNSNNSKRGDQAQIPKEDVSGDIYKTEYSDDNKMLLLWKSRLNWNAATGANTIGDS